MARTPTGWQRNWLADESPDDSPQNYVMQLVAHSSGYWINIGTAPFGYGGNEDSWSYAHLGSVRSVTQLEALFHALYDNTTNIGGVRMTAETVYGGGEKACAEEMKALRVGTRRAMLVAVLAVVCAFVLTWAERTRLGADATAAKMGSDGRRIVWLNAPEFGRVHDAPSDTMYSVQGGLVADHTLVWRFRALPRQVAVSPEDTGVSKKRGFFGRLFGKK